MRSQRGILLLPVTLTLVLIGTLAYTMTREGSMNVAAVDAQYEIEVARYLAHGGVQLAKWRAGKADCNAASANFGKLTFKDVAGKDIGSVEVTSATEKGGILSVSLTATTPGTGGAMQASSKKVQIYKLLETRQLYIGDTGTTDTTIVRGSDANLSNQSYLEATDEQAHPLLRFDTKALNNTAIIQADLELTKQSSNSTQADRWLGAHRITRAWSDGSATWTSPWSQPGGDVVETPAASEQIDKNSEYNGIYTFHIAALVQAWADNPASNHGVLLKPTRLVNARFTSADGSNRPRLIVRYFPRCT